MQIAVGSLIYLRSDRGVGESSALAVVQPCFGVHEIVLAFERDSPEMHGKRKARRSAPTSSRDGAFSRGFSRFTNALHCCVFRGSLRKSSVRANGAPVGAVDRRLSKEARIAVRRVVISNVQVFAMNQMS